ncbi:response regulator [Trichothermofontia sp.]
MSGSLSSGSLSSESLSAKRSPSVVDDILIVDDQPDNIRMLDAILRREGYRVRKSLSGELALESVRSLPPDLILLDIRMPTMDGYAVCAALKADAETAQIPVIFLSALSDITDKAKGFAIGAVDYITKPFQVEEVLIRVQHQLTLRRQQQELARLNQQFQQYNLILEKKVQARTQALQESLNFEATLKRISDHVRDSLDSQQIMRSALAELEQVLALECCHATLYENGQVVTHLCIHAEEHPDHSTLTLELEALPGVRTQLASGEGFTFCTLPEGASDTGMTIAACPIFDDRLEHKGIAGVLWLFRAADANFSDSELRLIQQVANQCAIALRQARLYEAAQQQVQALQRLNQLKDDFLSTVSHELRSPLATINLAVEMIPALVNQMLAPAQPIQPNSKLWRYLTLLKEACHRELRLVEDLLCLQTLEAGNHMLQPTPIVLPQWLPMILQPSQSLAESQQQTLTFHFVPNLPPLYTDSPSLNRIMTELVSNACKYAPLGAKITVSASVLAAGQESGPDSPALLQDAPIPFPCDGTVPSCTVSTGQTLEILVHNTGSYIPLTEHDRIFDKFYRIPNQNPWKHGGTGLGLALVRKLVECLGATIAVASDEQGTCFRLQFALATSDHPNTPHR